PAADALYPSKLEPWSPYLTGRMGRPPKPFYDPLKFAIEQAHRRGLQLHVWFNPYRVRAPGARGHVSPDDASQSKSAIIRKYGNYLWFDPGEPAAEDHFIAVLNDVVKRYDIDGVHIDDYFYPYQIKGDGGNIVPFPDNESYQRAVDAGETLSRDDWRRQNVNRLIQRMYEEVKRAKPWVLVGISPFGIWRPGHPEGITGLDQYDTLYADVRKWQHEGWLDYLTPQLYWRTDSEGQNYAKLLGWWHEQNLKQRHLWPGNFTSKVRREPDIAESRDAWSADELLRQVEATRNQPGASGNVHFSMKALMRNYDGIADKLKMGAYAEPALVPESSWLGDETPPQPEVEARHDGTSIAIEMRLPDRQSPWQWVMHVQTGDGWKTAIVPGRKSRHVVRVADGVDAKQVVVSAVTRLGREGPSARAPIVEGTGHPAAGSAGCRVGVP
ncbi:MAG TPA: family 10 glycosylhydrolase, partial [Lacipirellulaceae bacterium]|nr:family 10 glycosylhydrolase [Lacipirellulaceae bacterium]